jgi:hypothetical protein
VKLPIELEGKSIPPEGMGEITKVIIRFQDMEQMFRFLHCNEEWKILGADYHSRRKMKGPTF